MSGEVLPVLPTEQIWEWCGPTGAGLGAKTAAFLDRGVATEIVAVQPVLFGYEAAVQILASRGIDCSALPKIRRAHNEPDKMMQFVLHHAENGVDANLRLEQRHLVQYESVGEALRTVSRMRAKGLDRPSLEEELLDTAFPIAKQDNVTRDQRIEESLKDRLRRAESVAVFVNAIDSSIDLDAAISVLDVKTCKGLWVWGRVWASYTHSRLEPKKGDLDDLYFVSTYSYTDWALTERAMRHLIHVSCPELSDQVTSSITEFVDRVFGADR